MSLWHWLLKTGTYCILTTAFGQHPHMAGLYIRVFMNSLTDNTYACIYIYLHNTHTHALRRTHIYKYTHTYINTHVEEWYEFNEENNNFKKGSVTIMKKGNNFIMGLLLIRPYTLPTQFWCKYLQYLSVQADFTYVHGHGCLADWHPTPSVSREMYPAFAVLMQSVLSKHLLLFNMECFNLQVLSRFMYIWMLLNNYHDLLPCLLGIFLIRCRTLLAVKIVHCTSPNQWLVCLTLVDMISTIIP